MECRHCRSFYSWGTVAQKTTENSGITFIGHPAAFSFWVQWRVAHYGRVALLLPLQCDQHALAFALFSWALALFHFHAVSPAGDMSNGVSLNIPVLGSRLVWGVFGRIPY